MLLIVGWMGWQEMKISLITSNLPVLLFVLMLPYTVYFVERYRERRAADPSEEAQRSTFQAARGIFLPCLFSCMTTMAGFAALTTSGTVPVRNFGQMMAIGMAIGLLIVFLAIPSMSRPFPGMRVRGRAGTGAGTRGLVRLFERASLRVPGLVVLFSALLLGVSVWGATRITAEVKFTEYFWPRSEVYQGLEYIDQRMGGTTSLEIMLESEEDGFFLTQPGFDALAAVERFFASVPETGTNTSLLSLESELAKRNEKLARKVLTIFYAHPMGRTVIATYVTQDFRTARVFVRMRETAPTLHRNDILRRLRAHLAEAPELEELAVCETGIFLLYANMLNSLIASQKQTFLLVILAIFLMVFLLMLLMFRFRSPLKTLAHGLLMAFLVLLPQVLPAVVMLGVMGWLQIPLDLVTVMIASIAMAVGIDAAIQYTARYRAELAVDGDHRAALSRSHATIGRAIWIATTVIVVGFCVLMLSDFKPSVWFGLFTAIAMLMSQFAALTVLPSLFVLTGLPKVRDLAAKTPRRQDEREGETHDPKEPH